MRVCKNCGRPLEKHSAFQLRLCYLRVFTLWERAAIERELEQR